MELPGLGVRCAMAGCQQLDFLPFVCDACGKCHCAEHRSYDGHSCTERYKKNHIIPRCPICNEPVSYKLGEDPNIKMNEHISANCRGTCRYLLYRTIVMIDGVPRSFGMNCQTKRKSDKLSSLNSS